MFELNKENLDGFQRSYASVLSNTYETSNVISKKPLLEANMNRILYHIYNGAPVMFISAERPIWKTGIDENGNKIYILDENGNKINIASRNEEEKRRKVLVEKIIDSRLSFIKLVGRWADVKDDNTYEPSVAEISFMVNGCNRETGNVIIDFEDFKNLGIKWCKELNQSAVIIGKAKNKDNINIYKNPIEFTMYNDNGDTELQFTKINFGTSNGIEEVHRLYIKYINGINYGIGNTGIKNKSNKFMLSDDTEYEFIKNNPNIIDAKKYITDVYYGEYAKYYNRAVNIYQLL